MRLDQYLVKIKNISRTEAQKLIKDNQVKVNNKIINKNNYDVKEDADIKIIEKIESKINKNKQENGLPIWEHDIEVVYEDKDLLVVNKESGIIVHPTSFNEMNTLANALKYYFLKNNIVNEFDDFRNGICHRLDKDTSGLIVVAKTKETLNKMVDLFKENKIKRIYSALIVGRLETNKLEVQAPLKRISATNKWEVSSDFDALDATTIFYKNKEFRNFSLVNCELLTGRTHQIRAHAKYIKHNIINDPVYGPSKKTTKYGQYLVANKIRFIHPITNEVINLEIDLPKEFEGYIAKYGK